MGTNDLVRGAPVARIGGANGNGPSPRILKDFLRFQKVTAYEGTHPPSAMHRRDYLERGAPVG